MDEPNSDRWAVQQDAIRKICIFATMSPLPVDRAILSILDFIFLDEFK